MRRYGPQAEAEILGRWRKRRRCRPSVCRPGLVDPAIVRGLMDPGATREQVTTAVMSAASWRTR